MAEILDAEFNLVPNQAGENELPASCIVAAAARAGPSGKRRSR